MCACILSRELLLEFWEIPPGPKGPARLPVGSSQSPFHMNSVLSPYATLAYGWLSKLWPLSDLNTRCHILLGTRNGTILLTTTHILPLDIWGEGAFNSSAKCEGFRAPPASTASASLSQRMIDSVQNIAYIKLYTSPYSNLTYGPLTDPKRNTLLLPRRIISTSILPPSPPHAAR